MAHHLAVSRGERVAVGSMTAGRAYIALTDSAYSHNVVGQLMGQRPQVVPSVGPIEDYPRRVSEQGESGVGTVPASGIPRLSVRSPDKFHRY